MKTLHLSIIAILALISSISIMTDAFAQNETSTNTNNVEIQNIQTQPSIIKVGDTFAINATLVNNLPNAITVKNGCGGPFSVVFDNHAMVEVKKVCNWMAPQIILNPGENITGTSLVSNLDYKAVASGTTNATVTFSYIVDNKTANLSFDNNATDVSKSFLFTISDQSSQTTPEILSPLQQFKSGISANNVVCANGLTLAIKAEDGSPACVRPENVANLVERGWANQAFYYHDTHVEPKITLNDYSYAGIDEEGNTTVSIDNQTYYQTTLNYSAYRLPEAIPIQFHNITFTFPAGTMLTPGGAFVMLDVKFPDGFEETYGTHTTNEMGGIPVPTQYGPHLAVNSTTVLSNHIEPQAGMTIYHDKIKLLVSTGVNSASTTNVCGQFYTAPGDLRQSNTVPVLLMNSNSTACARLTFTIISNYKDCNGQTCQNIISLDSTLHIGNLHYEKHDNMFSVSSGKDYTNSFNITTMPDTIDLDNYPIGANFTVTYVIKPLPNATGFYDQSIPKLACERYPLAVGYTADQVDTSDFSYIDPLNPPCVAGVYTLTGVEIAGMSYKEVALP